MGKWSVGSGSGAGDQFVGAAAAVVVTTGAAGPLIRLSSELGYKPTTRKIISY